MGEPGGGGDSAGATPACLSAHLPLFFPVPCKLSLPLARYLCHPPPSEKAVPVTNTRGFTTLRGSELRSSHSPFSNWLSKRHVAPVWPTGNEDESVERLLGKVFFTPKRGTPTGRDPFLHSELCLVCVMPEAGVIWRSLRMA